MAQGQQQADPQQMAARAEQLRTHLEQLNGRLELLSTMREEKKQALDTLRAVENASVGDEILFPVGGTVFVNATLGENKQVLMGVGAEYAMPHDIDKATKVLEKDVEELGSEVQALGAQASKLEAEYSGLVQALQSMQQSMQQ